jgi:hypothetical protein
MIVELLKRRCSVRKFKDVPKDHWAAESVSKIAGMGIVKGYPDNTYRGSKPVTRYELAVALENMVRVIQESRKPLFKPEKAAPAPSTKAAPAESLKTAGFLPADSPLLKDTGKPVTVEELAQALTSVATKLVEQDVPATPVP